MNIGIPPAVDTDVEDVVWALQTAASLWKRNERVDAIVWLRRAAQAANDAENDDRALELAREAAELSDWIAHNPLPPASTAPPLPSSIPPNESATGGVDDLLRDIPIEEMPGVSLSAPTAPTAFMPVKMPIPIPMPPTTSDLIPISEPSSPVVFQSVASEKSSENVQSAAEAHAGMLNPWGAPPPEELPPVHQSAAPSSIASSEDAYDDEVVTSARLMLPEAEPAMIMNAPLPAPRPPTVSPAPPPVPPPAPPIRITPLRPGQPDLAPELAPDPMQELSQQVTKIQPPPPEVRAAIAAAVAASRAAQSAPPPPAPPPPIVPPAPAPPVVRYEPEATLVSAGVEPPPRAEPKAATEVDLASVDALADLPDDAREELERVAQIHRLSRDEEIMGFALAYVVDGAVDVAAQIVDVPAHRVEKGSVLKAKGTVAESVPLRLICASDSAVVATWDATQIEPAFKACPWVEDDLRAIANHVQALVGVTLGPLADRLDATLRAQITSKLELRELAEGDVIVEAGHPVRDLCLVGQGTIELVTDGAVTGQVSAGEFLFPSEIMGGGKATSTARAGKGGVLLLASDRAIAQELMVTCPPLLEIFAGM